MADIRHLYTINKYVFNLAGDKLLISDIHAGRMEDNSSIKTEFIDIIIKKDMIYPDESQYITYDDIKRFINNGIDTITCVTKECNRKGNIDIIKTEYVGYTTNFTVNKNVKAVPAEFDDYDFDYVIRLYKDSEAYIQAKQTENEICNLYDGVISIYESIIQEGNNGTV